MIKLDTKVLCIGDLHLGVNKNNSDFFETALKYADWINELCEVHQIKTVIQLGDIFHNREMIHTQTMNCANQFFNKLEKLNLHIIVGNHDALLNETSDINSLKLLNKWPNITIHEKVTTIDGVTFCGWGTKLSDIPEKQRIIFGHFDIKGFQMTTIKVSDHGFTASELMERCSLLMSGHYHKPQVRLYDTKPLVYTGSAYQLNWGETGEDKFVYILDTETLVYTPIKNTISPRFEFIRSAADYNKIPNNYISTEIENPEDFNITVSKYKGMSARDVRTTYKMIPKTVIEDDDHDNTEEELSKTPIEDAIDEYMSSIGEINENDKTYISDHLRQFYLQSV